MTIQSHPFFSSRCWIFSFAYQTSDILGSYEFKELQEDTSAHDYECSNIHYFPAFGKIVLFEKSSVMFKIYTTKPELVTTVRGHRGPLISVTYSEKTQQLITTSEDCTIRYAMVFARCVVFHTRTSFLCFGRTCMKFRFWDVTKKFTQVLEIKTKTPQGKTIVL